MILISLIALALVGCSVVLVARGLALSRIRASHAVDSIQRYGFSPPAAVKATSGGRGPAFGDLAAQLGSLVASRFRRYKPEAHRRTLVAAGIYRLSPSAFLGYRIVAAVAFALLGAAAFGSSMLGLAGVAAVFAVGGWLLPLRVLHARAQRRLAEIDRELPDLIDLLVVTVEAGSGLGASLALATRKLDGPLTEELRLMLQEQRMGRTLREAMLEMLERVDTPNMRAFVRSVTQGETLGVSIGTVMRNLASEMRKRRRASAQEQAQKAPVKMIFPLVFFILPAFIFTVLGPSMAQLAEQIK